MKIRTITPWAMLLIANVAMWGMLGLYQSSSAAPRGAQQPFANAVAQRAEMIAQLKAISAELKNVRTQLKTQGELLQSGKVKVVVQGK
jgi:hypothetical protein